MYFKYNSFDVILLYKFIRYLCFLLELINKWGNKLIRIDLSIGDDIEWIWEFRNVYFVYIELVEILNDDFDEFWKDVKFMIYRL